MKATGLLHSLFKRQMEHCAVSADETVAMVTDVKSPSEYVGAAFGVAQDLGADIFEVQVPRYGRNEVGPEVTGGQGGSLRLPRGATEAAKSADMVFDLTLEGFIHVPERDEILDAGARVLRVGGQPAHILRQIMPWTDAEAREFAERAEAAVALLEAADEMRVTSPHGTDVTMEIEPPSISGSKGYVDEPGQWDVWGQHMVTDYASNHQGTVVTMPGDFNVVPYNDYIDSRIECVIEDGYITEINGDGKDAAVMRGHLASYDDPDVYAASHFGWGLNPKGDFYDMAIRDRKPDETGVSADIGRFWAGNMLWSTGPDRHKERYTICHYDIAQRDCSIYLDGEQVVDEGEVVHA